MATLDYLYIRAWGKMLGSKQYYITDQVEQAREDNAPQNATYRQDDGTWRTFDDIISENTRHIIAQCVESYKR